MKDDTSSSTAYVIARSLMYLSRDPLIGGLIPPRAAEMSAGFVRTHSRVTHWLLGAMRPLSRPFIAILERLSIPGIQLHYVLRKRYLEDVARKFLEAGAGQMVVIGGGFDTLALRLHDAFPSAQFIEIDHPATQRIKRETAEARHTSGENLCFLPVDLARKTLEESLLACGAYRKDVQTLFLCEGVLMYLNPDDIARLLSFIRGHGHPRSRIAFTFMESENGRIRFQNGSAAVDLWLWLRGEIFTWGIPCDRLPDYLASNGFSASSIVTPGHLRARYLAPARLDHLPLAEGECICVARISPS